MLKSIPILYMAFGTTTVILADVDPSVVPGGATTITSALIGSFVLMVSTLVYIAKRQLDVFPAALKDQQAVFSAALRDQQAASSATQASQNTIFATILDKVREDNQKTMDKLLGLAKEPGRTGK